MRRFLLLALLLLNIPLSVSAQDDLAPITPENIADLEQIAMLGGGVIDQVEWSPDGATIAVASSVGVWLYDAYDLDATPRLLPHPASVYDVAFDATGTRLASGAGDATARVWDVSTGELMTEFAHRSDDYIPKVRAVAFSPDGTLLAFGVEEDLYLADFPANTEREPITHSLYSIVSLDFNEDGTLLAVGTKSFSDAIAGGTLILLAESGALVSAPDEPALIPVKQVQFNPDSTSLLTEYDLWEQQTESDRFGFWNISSGVFGAPLETADWWQSAIDVVFSPSGSLVAVSEGNRLVVREFESGEETASHEFDAPAISKAFNPNGSLIALLSNDQLHIWSLETGGVISASMRHSAPFEAVAISPDAQFLAAASEVGNVRLWRLGNPPEEVALEASGLTLSPPTYDELTSRILMVFSDDSRLFAVATHDGQLAAWTVEDGSRLIPVHPVNVPHIWDLAFTGQGNLLIPKCDEARGKRIVNQVPQAQTLNVEILESPCLIDRVFAADAPFSRYATASGQTLVLRDFRTDDLIAQTPQQDAPLIMIFSPDADMLAYATGTSALGGCCILQSLQLWELSPDTDPVMLMDSQGEPSSLIFPSLDFSTDGSLLAAGSMRTGSAELPIYLWDVSGSPPNLDADAILYGHTDTVSDVEFNADGTLLVSASYDGTVRVWGVR